MVAEDRQTKGEMRRRESWSGTKDMSYLSKGGGGERVRIRHGHDDQRNGESCREEGGNLIL